MYKFTQNNFAVFWFLFQ